MKLGYQVYLNILPAPLLMQLVALGSEYDDSDYESTDDSVSLQIPLKFLQGSHMSLIWLTKVDIQTFSNTTQRFSTNTMSIILRLPRFHLSIQRIK